MMASKDSVSPMAAADAAPRRETKKMFTIANSDSINISSTMGTARLTIAGTIGPLVGSERRPRSASPNNRGQLVFSTCGFVCNSILMCTLTKERPLGVRNTEGPNATMRSSTLRSSRVLAINDGDRLGHNTKVEDHRQPYTKMTNAAAPRGSFGKHKCRLRTRQCIFA